MVTSQLHPFVVDRVYAECERLERAWSSADLKPDFADCQRDAVFALIPPTGMDPEQAARLAVYLLRRRWMRHARRDAARHAEAAAAGRRATFVPLQPLLENECGPSAGLFTALESDPDAGETGRAVAWMLERWGEDTWRAWVVVWRMAGHEWDDVAFLSRDRFGVAACPAALRKWWGRKGRALEQSVRAAMNPGHTGDSLRVSWRSCTHRAGSSVEGSRNGAAGGPPGRITERRRPRPPGRIRERRPLLPPGQLRVRTVGVSHSRRQRLKTP